MSAASFKVWPAVYTAAKAHGITADEVRDVFASHKPKRVRKLLKELGIPVPASYVKSGDTVSSNVQRTVANAPTPRTRATGQTRTKSAAVKRDRPTVAEVESKRAARFDARADAGYVDTLFTFQGDSPEDRPESVVLVTGKYAPRFVSITGASPSKSLRETALCRMIDLAVSIALGEVDPEDVTGDAATVAGAQYVADLVASRVA